jgi:putative flippase GtrA
MTLPVHGLYSRIRPMLPELIKFCLVGGVGTVIDLGGAGLLHSKYHVEPLAAKAISVTAATTFTYLGARFWTFKHRENQSVQREAALFFALNIAGLLIAEAVIGLVTYVMGLRGTLDYNAASVIGTGLGTIFRFYAYRKWVFLAPSEQPAAAPADATAAVPDYPPWELDPAFLAAEVLTPDAPRREAMERLAPAGYGAPLSAPVPTDGGRLAPTRPVAPPGPVAPRPAGRHRKS